jgi:hypothetical protein
VKAVCEGCVWRLSRQVAWAVCVGRLFGKAVWKAMLGGCCLRLFGKAVRKAVLGGCCFLTVNVPNMCISIQRS